MNLGDNFTIFYKELVMTKAVGNENKDVKVKKKKDWKENCNRFLFSLELDEQSKVGLKEQSVSNLSGKMFMKEEKDFFKPNYTLYRSSGGEGMMLEFTDNSDKGYVHCRC